MGFGWSHENLFTYIAFFEFPTRSLSDVEPGSTIRLLNSISIFPPCDGFRCALPVDILPDNCANFWS